jgi:methyl-accepting chemotaxis protein
VTILRDRRVSLIEGGYSAGVSAIVFIGFVAAGCIYIVAAKLGGVGQLYVTFVPIAAMLAYVLLITLARSLRLRDDQSGDNLYYMGFLFTLTSLGVSLYQFSAERAAEAIVQNFGIAIGSTIAGIGLRVVFNQMRRDPIEVERMMRLELSEAARRVRREMDSSVVEFGYFRRTAQQSAVDSLNHMTEAFDESLAKFFAKLDEVAKNVTRPVEEASRKSGAAISTLSDSVGATLSVNAVQLSAEVERLSGQVGAITTALDQLTSKLKAMQTPERVIEIRLESMAHSLARPIEQLVAQSGGQFKAVNDALTAAGSAVKSSANLITAARAEFDESTATNRVVVEAAVAMIRSTADVLNEIKASSREYVDALAFMLERTNQTMKTFADLAPSGAETTAMTDRLARALPVIEAKVQALARAADRITLAVDDFKDRYMRSEVVE